MKSKVVNMIWIVTFLGLIFGIGFVSYKRLANFYINDEIDYNEWSVELGSKFETDVASTLFGKFEFVNLNGVVRKILGQQEMNHVVKLNNGYLCSPMSCTSDETLNNYAEKVISLNRYLSNLDIPLLYVTTPYKTCKYDPELPSGVQDYGNYNIDRFLQLLNNNGVETLDIREKMYEEGINHYDMMYVTDHH